MKSDELDLSGLYDWIENGGDKTTLVGNRFASNSEQELTRSYVPDLYKELFQNANGTLKGIGLSYEGLSQFYEPEVVPFDPSFCYIFTHSTALAIANAFGAYKDGIYIDYPFKGLRKDTETDGSTITQSISAERIVVPSTRQEKPILTGRTLTSTQSHLVAVDEFMDPNMEGEAQFMFLRFNEEFPGLVDAALIIDLTKGHKPYGNAHVFTEDRKKYHEFVDAFELRRVVERMTSGLGGNQRVPERA